MPSEKWKLQHVKWLEKTIEGYNRRIVAMEIRLDALHAGKRRYEDEMAKARMEGNDTYVPTGMAGIDK